MKLKLISLAAALMATPVHAADTSAYLKAKSEYEESMDALCKANGNLVNSLFDAKAEGLTKREAQDMVIRKMDAAHMPKIMLIVENVYKPNAERGKVELEVVMNCLEEKQIMTKAMAL